MKRNLESETWRKNPTAAVPRDCLTWSYSDDWWDKFS